jgi:kinetochor protein Mis14/NSL1
MHTSIEEHEPFNTKLFDRAKDLSRREEDLIEEIAALRRKIPGVAVENAKSAYQAGLESDETVLRGWEESVREQGAELGVGMLERQEAVEGNWVKGVQGLERLKRTMPESVAKKERAERAENYVVARERK